MGDPVPVTPSAEPVVEKPTGRRPRANSIIRDIRAKALKALQPRLLEIVKAEGKVDPGQLLELALRVSVANMADTRGAASNGAIAVMLKLIGDGERIMRVANEMQDAISAALREAEARAIEDAASVRQLEGPSISIEKPDDDFLADLPDFGERES